jgi:hypothetical protein
VRRPRLTAFVVASLAAALLPASASAGRLTTGFNSDPVLTGPSAWTNPFWIDQARSDGAGVVRVNVSWAAVAPAARPPGFNAADPGSPGYDFSTVDAQVRALGAAGLQALINITGAPSWAEGPNRPPSVSPGTWKPDPAAFAQFAQASARRYDGSYRDPSRPGVVLPRVRYWQAWNEPNLDTYLTPQWRRSGRGFAAVSPGIYRSLLNAFYGAVKRVSASDVVASAGMAPYGNPPGVSFPGGYRVPPLIFDRQLLARAVHLDVLAQNSYPIHGPLWHAYQPQDVSVADMYKVAALLHAAERAGHALPRAYKPLWMTELGWDSSPPNPGGVPIVQQARWYEQALATLWRQGVDTVLLLQLVDAPPVPDYASSYQTGLYYVNGQPKPAATAFRFPFVASRSGHGTTLVWGRAPVAGRLAIQRLTPRGWRAITTLRVGTEQVFQRKIVQRGSVVLRAAVAGETSLTWST